MTKSRYCVLPFVHMHLASGGRAQPCCINPLNIGNASSESLGDIWTGKKITKLRKNLLGSGDKSCNVCYQKEAAGDESLRQLSNRSFAKYVNTDSIKYTEYPKSLDIRLSNLCNLKCRTCWHGSSSAWYGDAVKLGKSYGEKALIQTENVDSVLKQLDQYLPGVEEVYFAGGEPLLMDEHYHILSHLDRLKRHNVRLHYSTNFTKLHYGEHNLLDIWKRFKNLALVVSIDGIDEDFGYIRHGGRYGDVIANMRKVKSNVPQAKISISITVSIFNIFSITKVIDRLLSENVVDNQSLYFNILETPEIFNIKIMSASQRDKVDQSIKEYIYLKRDINPYIAERLGDILVYLNSGDLGQYREEFSRITKQLDKIRGEDFETQFSETQELIDIINID